MKGYQDACKPATNEEMKEHTDEEEWPVNHDTPMREPVQASSVCRHGGVLTNNNTPIFVGHINTNGPVITIAECGKNYANVSVIIDSQT